MKKIIAFLLLFTVFFAIYDVAVFAAVPYRGYIYTVRWGGTASPNAYIPLKILYGQEMGTTNLNSPGDLAVRNNTIYIADTGNNRIVILDKNYQFIREITSFIDADGSRSYFNSPEGLFVTPNYEIFICDTENSRIVVLDNYGNLIKIIGEPVSDILPGGFRYFPIRVAVSRSGRIYVIGRGVFHGIMEFSSEGEFSRFLGTNRVSFNPIDYFWRSIATEEQRARMVTFLPTAFNSLEIDSIGFIYTTVGDEGTDTPIQRLNPTGIDVLRRPQDQNLQPVGELSFVSMGTQNVTFAGSSVFVDITVNDYGMYAALDNKRGRIFVYSAESQLLYIFGKHGIQEGTFGTPVAINWVGDDLVVLDRGTNNLTVFTPTEYGRFINQAVKNQTLGNDEMATYYWNRVLQLNSNYDLAYVGIGRALLRQGYYRKAMDYFMLGNSRFYYSRAFTNHRRNLMREYLGHGLTGVVVLSALTAALRIHRKVKAWHVKKEVG